ncbi:MAG TPA: nitroreductase family protein [Bacteroidota bacterium]|nr:nitroreductase family protein [Bacteroidota bacterium]
MKNFSVVLFVFCLACAQAQEVKPIKLFPPQTEIGKPLMQALQLRQSNRNFDTKPIPLQELSNLLWAAAGINRPESGKRTTPSAMNRQEVDVYAFLAEGTFLYNAKSHTLEPIAGKDLRPIANPKPPEKKGDAAPPRMQPGLANAPLILVFIADEKKLEGAGDIQKIQYSSAAAGFMIQNVYLYCASQGLISVVRASFDGAAITKELQLRPEQRVVLVQSVGYPQTK